VLPCRIRASAYLVGLAALALAAGCGDGSGDAEPAPGGADPGGVASGGDAASLPDRFTLEGRGASDETGTALRVIEGQREVLLTVRGADAMGSLMLLYVYIDGVENVVGTHRIDIGAPGADASAAGSVDGLIYYSLRGQMEVEVTADRHASGSFDMALALDETGGGAPPPGVPLESIAEALTLSGSFRNQWQVNCSSYIEGFTGSHLRSDSPYCNALQF
jgi:hypothetical protein